MVIPVIPLIDKKEDFYTAYTYISRYQWVEDLYVYEKFDEILDSPNKIVYERAEKLWEGLKELNRGEVGIISRKDIN